MSTVSLSQQDRVAIRAAVEEAESRSGAEFVPVVAEASDPYRLADLRAALGGAVAGVLLQPLVGAALGWADRWTPAIWTLVGAVIGMAAARVPAVRIALAGEDEVSACVASGARDAFLSQEVFRTRDRTGLLIYVSLLERRVEVLADEGVYRAVPKEDWQKVANEVAAEMSRRAPAAALLEAIARAGALVAVHGPYRRADDVNELPDQPIES